MRAHYVSIAECDQVHGTAVVIDVLRAFSTAAWAFHLGVERIVLTADLDDALRIKASIPRALAMKDSRPMEGFELSNSPVELQAGAAASRARRSCSARRTGPSGHGQRVLPSNSTAPASSLHRQPLRPFGSPGAPEVFFVVTGEDGIAEEDLACAEYIAAFVEEPDDRCDPVPRTRATPRPRQRCSPAASRNGTPGVHALDIETCLRTDVFDFVMRAAVEPFGDTGLLTLRAYNHANA